MRTAPARSITRRRLILGGVAAGGVATIMAARWYNLGASAGHGTLSVEAAHARATSGDLLLVDIRRPDEWARTGLGEGAHPLDMRRNDFLPAFLEFRQEAEMPAAVICARGVRSRRLAAAMAEAGIGGVLDVPEGMLGSGAGPGWLRKGLPVVPWPEGTA
jgi:rhodanese-related sulfurtransferase